MKARSNSYTKKPKISEEDFEVLHPHKYLQFLQHDYNVKQLKCILKSYCLKSSGNKNELTARIYNYMKDSYYVTIIQRQFRKSLMHYFYKIQNKHSKQYEYNNECDFYTMEEINNIRPLYLYKYKDNQGFYFTFKISSLIKYFEISKTDDFVNPYNRSAFSGETIDDIIFLKNMYKIYTNICEVDGEIQPILSRKQKCVLKLTDQFHMIDMLGNYSDINWFLSLNKIQLSVFLREFYDIWNYRAQLSEEAKQEICPLNGTPFNGINMSMVNRYQEHNRLTEMCMQVFDNILLADSTDANKSLGALYILSALTLVSEGAADAMPWLYQSVAI
jgi:hypothetical protein